VAANPLDGAVVVGLGEVQPDVDVDAAAAAGDAELRLPKADSRSLAGQDPDRFTMRPALDHRQAQDDGVELLSRLEVDHPRARAR
jgi:hypothetical protein